MDPPAIRYARTRDGVNIAFSVLGEGAPLVYLQPFCHQQLDWTVPELRRWLSALAQTRQVIRLDTRRFGLSDRPERPISLETLTEDLRAVIDAVNVPRVDLMGISGLGLPAIAYAVANPERVGHLVLWGAVARGKELFESTATSRVRAWEALYDIDPPLVQELVSRLVFGEDAMQRPECATHTREAVEVPHLRAYTQALRAIDLTPALPEIPCPTLLMLPRSESLAPAQDLRMMATTIPSCELSYCEGAIYPHRGPNPDDYLRTLHDFLDNRGHGHEGASASLDIAKLTQREIDVLDRIARGSANQEIAQALGLSVRTVERHITNIYQKIDARGRADATVFALTHGLGAAQDTAGEA